MYVIAVAPAELESVLNSHPDVGDCAVIGVYSKEQATELPKYAHQSSRHGEIINR